MALGQLGFAKDQKCVLSAWISPDGHYGFCEVRTIEEATAALTYLNGIQVGAYCLKIGRPKGYTGTTPAALPLQVELGMYVCVYYVHLSLCYFCGRTRRTR